LKGNCGAKGGNTLDPAKREEGGCSIRRRIRDRKISSKRGPYCQEEADPWGDWANGDWRKRVGDQPGVGV